jgi:SAM-dependent methyltransferase
VYDRIGVGYREHRRPDPRIAAQIHAALGDARTIVNVGGGAGAYEPTRRFVVSVDPSRVMFGQHPGGRLVNGMAEALPFRSDSFDAALGTFTVHHWSDPVAGLAELQRVSRRQVLLTFETSFSFWLTDEYVPEALAINAEWDSTRIAGQLGTATVEPVLVPHDCTDGFFAAYWRRPERYLDPGVRGAISGLALLPDDVIEPAMAHLADDLASGAWLDRHRDLLELDEIDVGYRLVVAENRA